MRAIKSCSCRTCKNSSKRNYYFKIAIKKLRRKSNKSYLMDLYRKGKDIPLVEKVSTGFIG